MEKLDRKALYEMPEEQRTQALEKIMIDFTEELTTINSNEDLEALEQELMKEFEEYDEHIKEVKYELQDQVEYDGTIQNSSRIKENIIYFLNQVEVDFRSTLGIYQTIKFWKTTQDNNIPYIPYETTLKILGTLKFKGEKQCTDILIVNNWFATAHEHYKRDAVYQGFLSEMHNAILNRMEEINKTSEEAPRMEE